MTDVLDLTTPFTTQEGTQTLGFWGNVQGDPSFVDRPSGDLHLQASSPLDVRGGGVNLSSTITTDMESVGRTTSTPTGMTNAGATGWSMGAYEKD